MSTQKQDGALKFPKNRVSKFVVHIYRIKRQFLGAVPSTQLPRSIALSTTLAVLLDNVHNLIT
jgi:hypothetical protein